VSETRLSRLLRAPRGEVYCALVDPVLLVRWRFPEGVRCEIHEFHVHNGGRLRVSLTRDAPGQGGPRTESYHGLFVELRPNEKVVELTELETADASLQGKMLLTIALKDEGEGTRLDLLHQDLPPGLKPEDNALGWTGALDRLAALLESGED